MFRETVFYKPLWLRNGIVDSEIYYKETFQYLEWAVQRKRKLKNKLKVVNK